MAASPYWSAFESAKPLALNGVNERIEEGDLPDRAAAVEGSAEENPCVAM